MTPMELRNKHLQQHEQTLGVWYRELRRIIKSLKALLNRLALIEKPRQDKQRKKMENCKKSDLVLNVRKRGVRRFKAGAELSSTVNIMDVDFNEEVNDTSELLEVKIKLTSDVCSVSSICEN